MTDASASPARALPDLTDTVSEALTAAAMSGAEVNVEIVMQGIAAAAGAAAEVEFDTVVEEEDDEFDEEFSEGVLDLGDTIAELLLNKPFSDEVRAGSAQQRRKILPSRWRPLLIGI